MFDFDKLYLEAADELTTELGREPTPIEVTMRVREMMESEIDGADLNNS